MVAQVVSVAVAAVGVLALLPIAAGVLNRHGVIDRPTVRSSHLQPTVRGAGLVTGPIMAVALAVTPDRLTVSLGVVALLATVIGGLEDLHGLGVPARLAGQLAIGAVFLMATWSTGAPLGWAGTAMALLFVVGYTNTFNFMDGVNGMSAAAAIVAGLALVALGSMHSGPDLVLAGAVVAVIAACFAPFNFPNARMFLGDSGSYSFGSVIACAVVAGWRAGVPADAIVAPLAIYLADAGTVVVRRLLLRQPITMPHRQHVYQRLVTLGASHAQSSGSVFAFSGVIAALGVAASGAGAESRVALDSGILVAVALYLSLPLLVTAHRELRRGGSK